MAHVPSRHVPTRHVPAVPVAAVSVRPVPSVPMVPIRSVPVPVVPVRSISVAPAPVIDAVRSAEVASHMKSAPAATMEAATSPRHGVGPRQQQTGEANSGDGDHCSYGHQLLDSKRVKHMAGETPGEPQRDGPAGALSPPRRANSTASSIKQARWLRALVDAASA